MEKSKLAKFLDNFSICFLIFIFTFLILKKHVKNNLVCLAISIIFCGLVISTIIKYQNKKYEKLGLKKQEEKQIENFNFHLRSMSPQKQTIYIRKLFENDFVLHKNNFFILKNQVAILNKISKNKVDEEDLFFILSNQNFLKKNNISEIAILCSAFENKLKFDFEKMSKFDLFFMTPEHIYKIAKDKNMLPELSQKTQNHNKFSKISTIFCQNKAKNMFRTSLVLFIFSLIIPFSKHYVYVGIFTLTLSLVLFFFGSKTQSKKQCKLLLNEKIETKTTP